MSDGTSVTVRSCVPGFFNQLAFANPATNIKTQALEIDNMNCNFCKEDLCNNANGMSISMIILGGITLLWATRLL